MFIFYGRGSQKECCWLQGICVCTFSRYDQIISLRIYSNSVSLAMYGVPLTINPTITKCNQSFEFYQSDGYLVLILNVIVVWINQSANSFMSELEFYLSRVTVLWIYYRTLLLNRWLQAPAASASPGGLLELRIRSSPSISSVLKIPNLNPEIKTGKAKCLQTWG